jgi:lipopolysaccharide/colanic/teichoic acid biosynthesis glycosyltransferase
VTAAQAAAKRVFDVVLSGVGLVVLSPLLLAAGAAVGLSSPGPIFFRQTRVGRDFRPFRIVKFRTMVVDAERGGGSLSIGDDPRITPFGRVLRRFKVDELPQLLNVLAGDMSLVGPRPEVPRFVERYRDVYARVLRVRPGITDAASLKYRDEAAILARAPDPDRAYVEVILPDKLRLAEEYVRAASLREDLAIIIRTLGAIAGVHQQGATS